MARCMTIRMATALGGWPFPRIQRSGSHRTSVTRTAKRRNSHCGEDEILVTMGHARQAITTPTMVSFP